MMKSIRMGKAVKATRSFAPRSSARRSVAAKAFTVTLETPDGTQTIECPDDVVRSSPCFITSVLVLVVVVHFFWVGFCGLFFLVFCGWW